MYDHAHPHRRLGPSWIPAATNLRSPSEQQKERQSSPGSSVPPGRERCLPHAGLRWRGLGGAANAPLRFIQFKEAKQIALTPQGQTPSPRAPTQTEISAIAQIFFLNKKALKKSFYQSRMAIHAAASPVPAPHPKTHTEIKELTTNKNIPR